MSDKSVTDSEISSSLQEALKSLRPTLRRAMDLSDQDVSAVIVEPILSALGWDVRNPRQARRPEGANLRLLSSGKPSMTVCSISSLEAIPSSLNEISPDSGEWIVVTNGQDWNIFNQNHPAQPFRSLSIKDAASQKDSVPVLAMLARDSFQKDGLTEAWMSEAVDRDIERILARHLDGSQALVDAIKGDLSTSGVTISDNDVRAALSRIDIVLNNSSEPSSEETHEEAKVDAAPAKRSTTSSKPTTRKSTAKTAGAAKKVAAPKKVAQSKPAAPKSQPAKATEAPETKSESSADAAEEKSNVTLPSSPDELGWPRGATHVMHRKKNIVFMKYDAKTGKSTILPGSLIVEKMGKALTPNLVEARDKALAENEVEPYGQDMLQVKKKIEFKAPRLAASFAAATLVKDLAAWKDKKGKTLEDTAPPKISSGKKADQPAAKKSDSTSAEPVGQDQTDTVSEPEAVTA